MALRNPNGPEGFITTFKDLGSMVAIYDEIAAGNLGIQGKLVASVEQQDYDFNTVKALSTFINNMVSASNNLDTAESNLVSAVSNYLTVVTASDIDSTSTTASGVLADLSSQMMGATSGTVAPSGVCILLSGTIYNFIWAEYGIVMPATSGSVYLSQSESMSMISGLKTAGRRQIDDAYGA